MEQPGRPVEQQQCAVLCIMLPASMRLGCPKVLCTLPLGEGDHLMCTLPLYHSTKLQDLLPDVLQDWVPQSITALYPCKEDGPAPAIQGPY